MEAGSERERGSEDQDEENVGCDTRRLYVHAAW